MCQRVEHASRTSHLNKADSTLLYIIPDERGELERTAVSGKLPSGMVVRDTHTIEAVEGFAWVDACV